MDIERKKRFAHEAIILLGVLALLTFITRLWPILLLVMVGILVCALRLLFIRVRTAEAVTPEAPANEPPPPETELTVIRKAFSLLQRRVTEQVEFQYPGARWVWGVSNALERFGNNEPLTVLLSGAGGYRKARVVTNNLLFRGLYYNTEPDPPVTPTEPEETESPDDADQDDDSDIPEDAPVNYGRLAFERVDANIVQTLKHGAERGGSGSSSYYGF